LAGVGLNRPESGSDEHKNEHSRDKKLDSKKQPRAIQTIEMNHHNLLTSDPKLTKLNLNLVR